MGHTYITVQDEYGGYLVPASPPEPLIAAARKAVNSIEYQLLFARVDGVERDGQFCLMELELIEPFSFLGQNLLAIERFGNAILSVLGQNKF